MNTGNNKKTYTIFAGVNGAGKSTLYNASNEHLGTRINTDEKIQENFNNDWQSVTAQIEASRIIIKQIKGCETEYVKSQETDNSERVNTLAGNMKLIDAEKKPAAANSKICSGHKNNTSLEH
jgi:predicted ABC-type ATPase